MPAIAQPGLINEADLLVLPAVTGDQLSVIQPSVWVLVQWQSVRSMRLAAPARADSTMFIVAPQHFPPHRKSVKINLS